jgi:hypothetical protein
MHASHFCFEKLEKRIERFLVNLEFGPVTCFEVRIGIDLQQEYIPFGVNYEVEAVNLETPAIFECSAGCFVLGIFKAVQQLANYRFDLGLDFFGGQFVSSKYRIHFFERNVFS